VATSGTYASLSGLPTLGTLSSQDASSIVVSGEAPLVALRSLVAMSPSVAAPFLALLTLPLPMVVLALLMQAMLALISA
jgi:hypothetical protein